LFVYRSRIVERRLLATAAIEVDLRLLRHREGSGHGDLDLPPGVTAQELQIAHADRVAAPYCTDHSRHRIRMAAAVQCDPGVVEVDALESGGEAIRVALAPDFPIGDEIESGVLLCLDRHDGGIVLGLLQI